MAIQRASAPSRDEALGSLIDDHKRVKKAYRQFQKLDGRRDREAREALVRQVLDELTVHAALEEDLLYPAARAALRDSHLVDEAEVEHESLHRLIDQLRETGSDDPMFDARFTVLCEYVLHHVKEEEKEMFPLLEKARGLDWPGLAEQLQQRREQLMAALPAPAEEAMA